MTVCDEANLSDLEHEPDEFCNLVEDGPHQGRRDAMRRRLLDRVRETGDLACRIDRPREAAAQRESRF